MIKFDCPVCGYDELTTQPRRDNGGASQEICPSCGYWFGYHDDLLSIGYREYRAGWKAHDCPWWSDRARPPGWNGEEQWRKMESRRTFSCPICRYDGLVEPPRRDDGSGSREICPQCGFQFGYHDDVKGIARWVWRRALKRAKRSCNVSSFVDTGFFWEKLALDSSWDPDEISRLCPVCGCLQDEAWPDSHQICPCCRIQYGYDDFTGGDVFKQGLLYRKWRADWKSQGCPWCDAFDAPPGWNGAEQLRYLEIIEGRIGLNHGLLAQAWWPGRPKRLRG